MPTWLAGGKGGRPFGGSWDAGCGGGHGATGCSPAGVARRFLCPLRDTVPDYVAANQVRFDAGAVCKARFTNRWAGRVSVWWVTVVFILPARDGDVALPSDVQQCLCVRESEAWTQLDPAPSLRIY